MEWPNKYRMKCILCCSMASLCSALGFRMEIGEIWYLILELEFLFVLSVKKAAVPDKSFCD